MTAKTQKPASKAKSGKSSKRASKPKPNTHPKNVCRLDEGFVRYVLAHVDVVRSQMALLAEGLKGAESAKLTIEDFQKWTDVSGKSQELGWAISHLIGVSHQWPKVYKRK